MVFIKYTLGTRGGTPFHGSEKMLKGWHWFRGFLYGNMRLQHQKTKSSFCTDRFCRFFMIGQLLEGWWFIFYWVCVRINQENMICPFENGRKWRFLISEPRDIDQKWSKNATIAPSHRKITAKVKSISENIPLEKKLPQNQLCYKVTPLIFHII